MARTGERKTCKMKTTKEAGTWRWWLVVATMAVCWGALRFSCCEEGLNGIASLKTLYDFNAPVPFGKRILTVWMAHGLTWMGVPMARAFEWIEMLGAAVLAEGLRQTFRPYLGESRGRVAGVLVFGILGVTYLLRSPLTIFVPWDTWAMALTAWGIHYLLEGCWPGVAVTMVLASFNRESAVLIPMLCAVIYAGRRPVWRFAAMTGCLLCAYAVCQWLVGLRLDDNGVVFKRLLFGTSWVGEEWVGEPYRLTRKWLWLRGAWERWFIVLGAMGGLPLWFAGVAGRLPGHLRRFGLVALGYLAMLAVVGNADEMRIYGETIVILFVPTVLGICDLMGEERVLSVCHLDGERGEWEMWMGWVEGASAALIVAGLFGLEWCLSQGWGP